MKDANKTFSERATRFLAVDMKDRLKSAFNRNSPDADLASESQRHDDAPDYTAIFNARSAATQKKSRFSGPLDQTQLAEPTQSVTMRDPARQIAHDIEEAEIVTGHSDDAVETSAWEAASLKTTKTATAEGRNAPPPPAVTVVESAAPVKPAIEPTMILQPEAKPWVQESAKPSFREPAKPSSHEGAVLLPKEDSIPQPSRLQASDDAVKAYNPAYEEPVAKKARFFTDFNSTESVRLKVDKRSEEHVANGESSAAQRPSQPMRPEPKPVVVKAQTIETKIIPAVVREPELKPMPKEAIRVANETVAVATPEQPNLKPQKENASMDAKGHETENGAAAKTESNAAGSAIAIERNSKFSGQLKFSGAIAIDGQVEGELVAERIVVHEGGVVNATIEGNTVVIAGNVKGDVYARNELEILPSGVVHGSVTAPTINVRRGGRVEGRCAIGVPRS